MLVSKSTRRIHRRENTAKAVIWGFAALTIIVLFWIIGFILIRGFYSNNEVSYEYLHISEEEIPLYQSDDSVIFIAHRGLRIKDMTLDILQEFYTSPIRELNNWGEATGQDIIAKPVALWDDSSFNSRVKELLLSEEGLSDWKNYTQQKETIEEILDYVGSNPGAIGYIPAEFRDELTNKVQIIPIRDLQAFVNPQVMEIYENRSLQVISVEQLNAILQGQVNNWKDLGGPDFKIELAVMQSIDLGLDRIIEQDIEVFFEDKPGSILLGRASARHHFDADIMSIERVERGPNLTLSFLFEKPASGDSGGISYFILNTLMLILLTLLFSTPVGIMAAVYLVEYAKQGPFVKILRMGTETLAGIPSIVFGLFGRIFFVRILGLGIGFLSSTLTVTLMILPTLVRTTEEALKSVPKNLREGSLAMGATSLQTIVKVVLPAASPGIITGIILAVGRVVGETAVLLYTLGSGYDLVRSLTSPARVLSLHLYLLFSEAVSFDRAFATATVLIFMVLITNLVTRRIVKKQSLYR